MALYYRDFDPLAINQKYPYKYYKLRFWSISDWIKYFS